MKRLLILLCLPMIGFGQGWQFFYGTNNTYEAGHSVKQTNDGGACIEQTNDGGYIISGWSESTNGDGDIYIIKTDGNGNVTSTFNIPTPNPNRKLEKVVDILGKETKPQPNTPFIEIYDDGTVEKRIIIE